MKEHMGQTWKVGKLAKATGITVRTLHHYEEIGLIEPSSRTESGHRVYSEKDIQRLQQVLSLRQLGFPLEDIRKCLGDKTMSPLQIIRLHQGRVHEERDRLGKLYDQLTSLERTLATNRKPSIHELIKTIEVITMHDKYFTKEQLEEIKSRGESIGDAKMKEYQESWVTLMEKVRTEKKNKSDPSSASILKLAQEWDTLVKAFTGGNPHIEVQLGSMYRNEPSMRENFGMDPELWEYVTKMMGYFHKLKK